MKKTLIVALTTLALYAQTFNVSNVAEFRQALEDVALNGESDTIVLDKGVYKTTEDGLGTFEFNDEEEQNLTIRAKDGLT